MDPYLPERILVQILAKLPIKSLLQCRCVSKYWHSLISDPKFNLSTQRQQAIVMSMPIRHSKYQKSVVIHLTDDEISVKELPMPKPLRGPLSNGGPDLRGSCNGLVLVTFDQDLFLWNPSTRWCNKVLSHWRLGNYRRGQFGSFISGLCYDSSTDDYKAVMVSRTYNVAMVGSFRNKTRTEILYPYSKKILELGPTANGCAHWLVHSGEDRRSQVMPYLIVSFDPQMNDFVEVPMPQIERIKGTTIHGFGVLGGCLSLTLSTDLWRRKIADIEVFALKKYGDETSWTSLFIVLDLIVFDPIYTSVVPLCFTSEGEALFQREGKGGVMACNPKSNLHRGVRIPSHSGHIYSCTSFVESLVSPPSYKWETEDYKEISLSGQTRKYNKLWPGVDLSK